MRLRQKEGCWWELLLMPLRQSQRYPVIWSDESPRLASAALRLNLPVSIYSTDRTESILPGSDELRICLTSDSTPIASILRTVPAGSRLDGCVYSIDEDQFEELLAQRKRGRFSDITLAYDRAEFQKSAITQAMIDNCQRIVCRPSHVKWWSTDSASGGVSIMSSSNEGCEGHHTEWWVSCRLPEVRRFLLADDDGAAIETKKQGACVPGLKPAGLAEAAALLPRGELAPVTIIRSGASLTSASLLVWLLQSLEGPIDLGLISFSTSIGFIGVLESCRAMGWLKSVHWSIDKSIRTRLGGAGGHTNIMPHLERAFPDYVLAASRIHAKWATLRTPTQTVSILSSANWQATNPREELYVIVTDPAVCAFLEQHQHRLNGGGAKASAVATPVACSTSGLLPTTAYSAKRMKELSTGRRPW